MTMEHRIPRKGEVWICNDALLVAVIKQDYDEKMIDNNTMVYYHIFMLKEYDTTNVNDMTNRETWCPLRSFLTNYILMIKDEV